MKAKELVLGVIVGALLAVTFSRVITLPHGKPRSRLFVSDGYGINGPKATFNHATDVRQSCPETVFALEEDRADYSLTMYWGQGQWAGMLEGNGAFLFKENSADFNKIVRDACKVIQDDEKWPLRNQEPKQTLLDRYELRELRNGTLSTSAILDKQTGEVWVWTNITRDGKETGKSAFVAEEVSPPPNR
jgi:hypothetical protein